MLLKVISFGGGVQSMALLVLAALGKVDYRIFLFCNVGEDSENPDTIQYVHEVAIPYAKMHGLDLHELRRTRFGQPETLYGSLIRPSRTIDIPLRVEGSGSPGNRTCTASFKIKVVDKWAIGNMPKGITQERKKQLLQFCGLEKITKETLPIVLRKLDRFHEGYEPLTEVGLGISLDELTRMKPNMDKETIAWKVNAFPLIDLRLDRQSCMNIIRDAGLPVPPKSSCFFCPYKKMRQWQELREDRPDLFQKACDLEGVLNQRRKELGRDTMWLTPRLKPLAYATTDLTQESLFEDEMCDSGYCMI